MNKQYINKMNNLLDKSGHRIYMSRLHVEFPNLGIKAIFHLIPSNYKHYYIVENGTQKDIRFYDENMYTLVINTDGTCRLSEK